MSINLEIIIEQFGRNSEENIKARICRTKAVFKNSGKNNSFFLNYIFIVRLYIPKMITIIFIIIYFKKHQSFHAQLGLDVPPEMKLLHISLNTAHSGCKPSAFISSFTHSYQVFLPHSNSYRYINTWAHCQVNRNKLAWSEVHCRTALRAFLRPIVPWRPGMLSPVLIGVWQD